MAFDRHYFTFSQKPFIWAPPPQSATGTTQSLTPPDHDDDAESDTEAEQMVLSVLTEGLDLSDAAAPEDAASTSATSGAASSPRPSRSGHFPPPPRPLPQDTESDNDQKHAAYCLAETCIANGLIYPPAFEWPNPWHAALSGDEMIIPQLATHPKLTYSDGRFVEFGGTSVAHGAPFASASAKQRTTSIRSKGFK